MLPTLHIIRFYFDYVYGRLYVRKKSDNTLCERVAQNLGEGGSESCCMILQAPAAASV